MRDSAHTTHHTNHDTNPGKKSAPHLFLEDENIFTERVAEFLPNEAQPHFKIMAKISPPRILIFDDPAEL
jgi:hypothetical protein